MWPHFDPLALLTIGTLIGLLVGVILQSLILYPKMVAKTVRQIIIDQTRIDNEKKRREMYSGNRDESDPADHWKPEGWSMND